PRNARRQKAFDGVVQPVLRQAKRIADERGRLVDLALRDEYCIDVTRGSPRVIGHGDRRAAHHEHVAGQAALRTGSRQVVQGGEDLRAVHRYTRWNSVASMKTPRRRNEAGLSASAIA